jgi:hypothetical protein
MAQLMKLKVEDISRGNQSVLGATRVEVVGDSGELPSVFELVVQTLSKGAEETMGKLLWER